MTATLFGKDSHGRWRDIPVPRRLDLRHLRRHAVRAIADRLKYAAPCALLAVERDGDSVVLRLNSGGNALAVQSWLSLRGYRAEYAGGNPDGYGCAVRVRLRDSAARRRKGD